MLHEILGNSRSIVYLHHPLLRDAEGRKLGKRILSESIASRRRAGEPAGFVLGEAAALAGLIPEPRSLTVRELAGVFEKGAAVFG